MKKVKIDFFGEISVVSLPVAVLLYVWAIIISGALIAPVLWLSLLLIGVEFHATVWQVWLVGSIIALFNSIKLKTST